MKQPVRVYINPHAEDIEEIIARPDQHLLKVQDQVSNIINVVQARGDKALFSFTKTFDGVELERLEVTRDEIDEGCRLVDDELKAAMETAKHNIKAFHAAQGKAEPVVETQPGVLCWRKNKPIETIGIYIPGGTAPLFSSVLMLSVPAVLAGCREIVMVTLPVLRARFILQFFMQRISAGSPEFSKSAEPRRLQHLHSVQRQFLG